MLLVEEYLILEHNEDPGTLNKYFEKEEVKNEIIKSEGREDISALIDEDVPIKDRLEYIVDMRVCWRWHSDLPSQRMTKVLNTTVIARQIGVGSHLHNGNYYVNWLMILKMSTATKTDYKENKEMIGPWRARSRSPRGDWLRCSTSGTGNDILKGYAATMNLVEQFKDGDDALEGGEGNDELWGAIDDLLAGGDGNDKLVDDDPMIVLLTMASPGQTYAGQGASGWIWK